MACPTNLNLKRFARKAHFFSILRSTNNKGKHATMSQRGAAIRFAGGKYSSGQTGWFDAGKVHTKCRYYVIVETDTSYTITSMTFLHYTVMLFVS
jgi:hypothetical protein